MKKNKKTRTRKNVTNYRTATMSRGNSIHQRNNSRIVKKTTRRKKMKINKAKIYRNLAIIFIIIIAVGAVRIYLSQRALAKQQAIAAAQQQQKAAQAAQATTSKKDEFFSKENTVLSDLQRYNQNVGIAMDYPSSEVNIYPDSLNAAASLKSNLESYAQYLTPTEISSITEFVNNLISANTTYINDIKAYIKMIDSQNPNMNAIKQQKTTISNDYTNLNNLISKNQNIFQSK